MPQNQTPQWGDYAKPGPYTTTLDPQTEQQFQSWVKQNNVPWKDSPTSDYDMRGYYKAQITGDTDAHTSINPIDGLPHYPDTYKTPYHKTFSNQSQYALPTAGTWKGNTFVPPAKTSPQSSDPLQPYLSSVPVDQPTRASAWDAYYNSTDENDFNSKIGKLNIPQTAKAQMWDSKFGGKNLPGSFTPPTPPPTSVKGPDPVGKPQPLGWDKIQGTLYPEALAASNAVLNAPNKYIIDPASAKLDQWRQQQQAGTLDSSPVVAGAKTFATGVAADTAKLGVGLVADPKNWPFLLSGTAEVAPALKATSSALFTGMQQKGAYDALRNGQYSDAAAQEGFAMLGLAHLPNELKETILSQAKAQANAQVAAPEMQDRVTAPTKPPIPDTRMDQVAQKQKMEVGAGTSAATLMTEPPKTDPSQEIQSHTGEIIKLQGIIDNPQAPPDQVAYAKQAIVASQDMRAEAQQRIAPKMVETMDGLQPVPNRVIPPTIAPEPKLDSQLDSISPLQQKIAQAAVENHPSVEPTTPQDEPLRRMVEDAGGKFHGTDSMGLAHYDAPADAVGGRNGVSISSPIAKMSPDFVQSEFARKAAQLPGPITDQEAAQAVAGNVIPALHSSIQRLVDMKSDLDATSDPTRIKQIQAAREAENQHATQLLQQHLTTASPDELIALSEHVGNQAEQHETMANTIKDAIDQHNRTAEFRQDDVERRAVGYTVDTKGIDPETGESIAAKKFAETGPIERNIMDTIAGKKPRVNLDDMVMYKPKAGLVPEKWDAFTGKVLGKMKAEKLSIENDLRIALDTGNTEGISEIRDRIKNLERDGRMIGNFPAAPGSPGRRPYLPVTDEAGNVRPMAPGEGITLERARQFMARQVRKIPSQNELSQRADALRETARLYKTIGNAVDKVAVPQIATRAGERGAVGEQPLMNTIRTTVRPEDFIAKVSRGKVNSDVVKQYRQQLRDTGPRNLRPVSIAYDERGDVTDADGRHRALAAMQEGVDRIPADVTRPLPSNEAGRVSGTEIMGGAAVGGLLGATHGPVGAAVGTFIGAVTPAVLRSKVMVDALDTMRPIIKNLGVSPHDWLVGPTQDPIVTPGMDKIMGEQKADILGDPTNYMKRLAQIPNDLRTAFVDRLGMLNDQRSPLGRYLGSLDERNRMIAGASHVSVDDSPYVTLYNAATRIRGEQSYMAWEFSKIENAALKAGLSDNLREHLNLGVYERTNNILMEKHQDLQLQEQNLQSKLASPSNTIRQRIALEDDLADTKKSLRESQDKIQSGAGNPQGYTPAKVALAQRNMEQALGPQKMAQVKALADQVYAHTRTALDMLHDHHVVSDEDYQKYVARGNTYIPASRIMSDLADNTGRWAKDKGLGRDAFLRQQQVVKALEGSGRVNRDPIVAAHGFINEAISESLRNKVANEYMLAAANDPKTYSDMNGPIVRPVSADYRPLKGESLIGSYIDGKPNTYVVPDWVHGQLEGASPIVNDVIGGAIARFAQRTLATGATTLNVGFSLMRIPTDFTRMAVLSKAGVNLKTFPYDAIKIAGAWASSIKSTYLKDPKWQEGLRSGAFFSGAQRNINPEHFLTSKVLNAPWKSIPTRILDSAADLNAAIEDSIKLTAFKRLREQGETVKAATYETKRYGGSPDYSRHGNLSPVANLATMFFNADMQHITQAFEKVGKNPQRMIPILGAMTAMQMMLSQHNWSQKDDNGQPLMRRVPITDREKYWIFLTEGTNDAGVPNMWKIRKPDFVSIFVNPIDNVLERVANREERSGSQIALDGLSHLIPAGNFHIDAQHPVSSAVTSAAAGLNPALRVPAEEFANKSFGTGAPIVSSANSKLDPEAQVGKNTSPVAKAVGSATGLSPQRVDHIMRGFTGSVSDEVQNIAQGKFGKLTQRFGAGNFNQQDADTQQAFYDGVQRVQTSKATFDHYIKTNPQMAGQYAQNHREQIALAGASQRMQERLSSLNQAEQRLQMAAEDNPKAAETLKSVHGARMQLMKAFADVLNR